MSAETDMNEESGEASVATAPVDPVDAGASAGTPAMLGLLQAHERHGGLAGRADVARWPVTVGRALDCDLVLDDPHVAAHHLRIDRDAAGAVRVEVLDTANGVTQRGRTWRRGQAFTWPAGEELHIGRLRIGLRLAEEPVAAELPLSGFPWRTTGWTLALAGLVLVLMATMTWLEVPESGVLAQRLPALVAGTAASLAVWSGLWALATRLFTGRLWFWRHVRIACATLLGSQLVETLAHLLAFTFSWETFARFDLQLTLLAGAVGVFLHLSVIAPHRRRGTAAIVAGVALMALTVLISSSWLQTRRLSSQLYMATVFPPSWRLAKAVPVPQFLREAQSIRERLERRLKDKEEESEAAGGDDDE